MRQTFSVLPASDAFDSITLARLTYARALPLPPSSYCPLFFCFTFVIKKEQPTMRQDFFSLAQSPRPSVSFLLA